MCKRTLTVKDLSGVKNTRTVRELLAHNNVISKEGLAFLRKNGVATPPDITSRQANGTPRHSLTFLRKEGTKRNWEWQSQARLHAGLSLFGDVFDKKNKIPILIGPRGSRGNGPHLEEWGGIRRLRQGNNDMKKPKANREDGIQASINKMLRGLASNGIIVLERLQSSWNTLKAAGAAEQKRFIAGLEATGIKICTGCADWLRIKQQWQLDVHLVTAAGPISPTISQNNIGG